MQNHNKDRTVFVVHGRNYVARDAVYDFLRSLDLTPLTWSGAVKLTGVGAPFVGDVVKTGMSASTAIIVLLTPDEETRLLPEYTNNSNESVMRYQPRPNVLFEAGMAMEIAKDKVILLKIGDVDIFSDISGLQYIEFTPNNVHKPRVELRQRLIGAGCDVNDLGSDWIDAGRFFSEKEVDSQAHTKGGPEVVSGQPIFQVHFTNNNGQSSSIEQSQSSAITPSHDSAAETPKSEPPSPSSKGKWILMKLVEQRVIPEGAPLKLDLRRAKKLEWPTQRSDCDSVQKWLDADPSRNSFTWTNNGTKNFQWSLASDPAYSHRGQEILKEVFRQAGHEDEYVYLKPEPLFLYNGTPLDEL